MEPFEQKNQLGTGSSGASLHNFNNQPLKTLEGFSEWKNDKRNILNGRYSPQKVEPQEVTTYKVVHHEIVKKFQHVRTASLPQKAAPSSQKSIKSSINESMILDQAKPHDEPKFKRPESAIRNKVALNKTIDLLADLSYTVPLKSLETPSPTNSFEFFRPISRPQTTKNKESKDKRIKQMQDSYGFQLTIPTSSINHDEREKSIDKSLRTSGNLNSASFEPKLRPKVTIEKLKNKFKNQQRHLKTTQEILLDRVIQQQKAKEGAPYIYKTNIQSLSKEQTDLELRQKKTASLNAKRYFNNQATNQNFMRKTFLNISLLSECPGNSRKHSRQDEQKIVNDMLMAPTRSIEAPSQIIRDYLKRIPKVEDSYLHITPVMKLYVPVYSNNPSPRVQNRMMPPMHLKIDGIHSTYSPSGRADDHLVLSPIGRKSSKNEDTFSKQTLERYFPESVKRPSRQGPRITFEDSPSKGRPRSPRVGPWAN